MKNINIIFAIGLFLITIPAFGFEGLPDAGIILNVSGSVTYSNKADAQNSLPVQAFMKIRVGDYIRLDKNSQIILIVSKTGTRETWNGPAALDIIETGIKTRSTPAHVEKLPLAVARHVGQAGLTAPRFRMIRTGGAHIRGVSESALKPLSAPAELNEKDKAEIMDARKVYDMMKKTGQKNDYVPDLYLLSVLSGYEQYSEVEALVDGLLKKDKKNPVFNHWKYWIQENYPIRADLFLMQSDPSCKGSDCIEVRDIGIYKKTGPFSISQSDSINAKLGNILTFNITNTSETDYYCYILNINSSGKWEVMFPDIKDKPDTPRIKHKMVYNLFEYAYFGLILENPVKEIIRIYTSPEPVEISKLLEISLNSNPSAENRNNLKIMQMVIPVK